tara:strand:+ start:1021 stop:1332 length:312 start_codon:yes stop_codon:yes gene_type:complete
MDELKAKAATKYGELSSEVKELKAEQVITNNLLCQLCDLKEAQQQGDIKFRNAWKSSKLNDTRISLVLLVLANIALYLDVIRVDGSSAFITGLMKLFSKGFLL